eukprot:365723-Chlamydomonas_euryale.AAC.1
MHTSMRSTAQFSSLARALLLLADAQCTRLLSAVGLIILERKRNLIIVHADLILLVQTSGNSHSVLASLATALWRVERAATWRMYATIASLDDCGVTASTPLRAHSDLEAICQRHTELQEVEETPLRGGNWQVGEGAHESIAAPGTPAATSHN